MHDRPDSQDSGRSADLLRDYKRALLWRKSMFVAFLIVFVAILIYAIPWIPGGLSVQDYNSRLMPFMVLVLAACLTAFGSVYHRDLSRRVEQTLLTWATVHDGLGDLRQREYFFDHIVIECERAKNTRGEFSVIVVRLDSPNGDLADEGTIERALQALTPLVKDREGLAALGPREIGVLAHISQADIPSISQRLEQVLADPSIGDGHTVRLGAAIYGVDSREAGTLVGLARERVFAKSPPTYGLPSLPDQPPAGTASPEAPPQEPTPPSGYPPATAA